MKLESRATESPSATHRHHVIRLLDVRPRENRTLLPRACLVRFRVDDAQQGRP